MPFYFVDYWYLILVLPAVLISVWAQIRVKSTFSKYSKKLVASGMTGADASRFIQQKYNVHTGLESVPGNLSDHYDPHANTIRLSAEVYSCASVAAVGVAAHETGHAIQHAEGYAPVNVRTKMVPITNIASGISPILIILGIMMSMEPLAYVGIALFCVVTLFQLVTLPVEFNASNRALAALKESGRFTEDEINGVRKVLTAAALTYVAALLVSLMTLLRFILMVSGNRRNDG